MPAPKVLLLDEPTVGVDPQSRVKLLELVRAQARAGATVLYTTHHMQEAEELCDRLAIVDHGKLIASGSLRELHARLGGRDLVQLGGSFTPERTRAALEAAREALGEFELVSLVERTLQIALSEGSRRLAPLLDAVRHAGGDVRETTLRQPSLESLFIALTGKELRE